MTYDLLVVVGLVLALITVLVLGQGTVKASLTGYGLAWVVTSGHAAVTGRWGLFAGVVATTVSLAAYLAAGWLLYRRSSR